MYTNLENLSKPEQLEFFLGIRNSLIKPGINAENLKKALDNKETIYLYEDLTEMVIKIDENGEFGKFEDEVELIMDRDEDGTYDDIVEDAIEDANIITAEEYDNF